MKKIMICDRFATEGAVELKKNKNFEVINFNENELSSAHVLVIRSKFKIDLELLEKTKNLELIITCTSGFDHIDLKQTAKRNITVAFTPEANVVSAAEHTWALLLACTRHVVGAHKDMKSGHWNREPFLTFELKNKTIGIVGLGRVGQKVAGFAKAFQMNVLAFDPYQTAEIFNKLEIQRVSYDELLLQSDILTFHVPATFETHHMMKRANFENVDENLILINTSRGSVINEDDLAEALIEKTILAAGLDVFAKEPLSRDSKLMRCPNLIMTPHLGAYTEEAFTKGSLQAAKQIKNFYENNKLENTLPLINEWGSLSFKERT